jgi:hypothetical protein
MAEREEGVYTAPGKFYYQLCGHCGERVHIDNLICGECGRRVKDFGERGRIYETSEDPKLTRHNLDSASGCPACAASCGYCHSFGAPEPSVKAHCAVCDKWRAACCKKARRLPTLNDVMPDIPVADILERKEGLENVPEALKTFLAEKIAECRSHVPDTGSAEFPPHEKSA